MLWERQLEMVFPSVTRGKRRVLPGDGGPGDSFCGPGKTTLQNKARWGKGGPGGNPLSRQQRGAYIQALV